MDDILFGRLTKYVKTGLNDSNIILDNLAKITLLVMEFVDSFSSNVSDKMTPSEKHELTNKWTERLISESQQRKIPDEVKALNSRYIATLCDVSKGRTKLNGADRVLATQDTEGTEVPEEEELEVEEPKKKKGLRIFRKKGSASKVV